VLVYEPVMEGRLLADPAGAPHPAGAAQPAGPRVKACEPAPSASSSGATPGGRPRSPSTSTLTTSSSSSGSISDGASGAPPADVPASKPGSAQQAVCLHASAGRSDVPAALAAAPAGELQRAPPHGAAPTAPHPQSAGGAAPTQPGDAAGAAQGSSRRSSGGKLLRRYLALQATFLFSGLWHMLLFRWAGLPGLEHRLLL
jgi:hypothetical protein